MGADVAYPKDPPVKDLLKILKDSLAYPVTVLRLLCDASLRLRPECNEKLRA